MRRLVVYDWADDLAGRIRDKRKAEGRLREIIDRLLGKQRRRPRWNLDDDDANRWTRIEIKFAESQTTYNPSEAQEWSTT